MYYRALSALSFRSTDEPKTIRKESIMSNKKYRFETLQLHVGQEQADPTTDEIGRAHV